MRIIKIWNYLMKCSYSFRMSLSTVLFPAPIPPPMKRRTGLLSLCAIGTITSVHCESSRDTSPIAFISSTNVVNTLATFRFFVTLSNLCSLSQFKTLIRLLAIVILVRRSSWSLITVAMKLVFAVGCFYGVVWFFIIMNCSTFLWVFFTWWRWMAKNQWIKWLWTTSV